MRMRRLALAQKATQEQLRDSYLIFCEVLRASPKIFPRISANILRLSLPNLSSTVRSSHNNVLPACAMNIT